MDHVLISYTLAAIAFALVGISGVYLHRNRELLQEAIEKNIQLVARNRVRREQLLYQDRGIRKLNDALTLVRSEAQRANEIYRDNIEWKDRELKKARRASEKRRKRIERALKRAAGHPNTRPTRIVEILKGEADGEPHSPVKFNKTPDLSDVERATVGMELKDDDKLDWTSELKDGDIVVGPYGKHRLKDITDD